MISKFKLDLGFSSNPTKGGRAKWAVSKSSFSDYLRYMGLYRVLSDESEYSESSYKRIRIVGELSESELSHRQENRSLS